jgi:hypothetical protein
VLVRGPAAHAHGADVVDGCTTGEAHRAPQLVGKQTDEYGACLSGEGDQDVGAAADA